MPNTGRRDGLAEKISNAILSVAAGIASFLFTLAAVFLISTFPLKLMASFTAGLFCLAICWVAAERPNSEGARATQALIRRLLAVRDGDFESPVSDQVRTGLPALHEAAERLFAEVRAAIEQARSIALFDTVTKLPNRLHFRSEVEKMLAARPEGRMAAMFFVDLDRFKAVNDNLGHARGDELLVMVADRLRAIAAAETAEDGRLAPLVARLAGDEFTVFAPSVEDVDDVRRIGARLLGAMMKPFTIRGQAIDIGASIGAALAPRHGADGVILMRAADIAMYQAKSGGRGQVVLFSDSLADEFDRRAAVQAGLRDALSNGEFELSFQPQMGVDGGVEVVEALVRWRHPQDGILLPTSFISVAEECGLINDLGDWVAHAVAETLGRWRTSDVPLRIALNVSPRQLDRSHFFQRLREVIVQGVVQIVHGIGCEAVGEGVEHDAQAELLRIIGCDALQGFAVCHPLSEQDLFGWLAERERLSPPVQAAGAAASPSLRIVSA